MEAGVDNFLSAISLFATSTDRRFLIFQLPNILAGLVSSVRGATCTVELLLTRVPMASCTTSFCSTKRFAESIFTASRTSLRPKLSLTPTSKNTRKRSKRFTILMIPRKHSITAYATKVRVHEGELAA